MNFNLPRIDRFRSFINREHNNYTLESYNIIDDIFEEMNCIKVDGNDEYKHIYIRYERGEFEDYAKLYDLDIKSKKKYKQEYKEFLNEYYMEYDWVEVIINEYKEYKVILINENLLINVVPKEERNGFELDLVDFLKDLLVRIKNSIEMIKNNTYYDKLCNEISYRQRTGIIKLDDLFTINPNLREEYYKMFIKDDLEIFHKNINNQIEYVKLVEEKALAYKKDYKKYIELINRKYKCIDRIKKMSAQDYYDICKLCYKSINLEGADELTSKELFYKYADGRDCGLKYIDLKNCDEFEEWVKNANDHACEIRHGSSTNRIDLWVKKDDNGFYLVLSGKYLWISNEVIKFYVELIKNNIPVYLRDAITIKDRLIGNGLIGIVHYKVFPRHCQSYFDIEICDFMNLPYYPDEYNKYLDYISWLDLENTFLKEN